MDEKIEWDVWFCKTCCSITDSEDEKCSSCGSTDVEIITAVKKWMPETISDKEEGRR